MKKFFKKAFKKLKKIVKPVGKALKTGLGSVSEALGPVGTLALSLMLPGIGAAFAGFTATAAATGGLMGTVMQGIAAAGNAVGTVYSTVSSMVGGVIKAIPGVGDAYTKLANFTAQTMDKGRMALGLPTSGATTAGATATAGNEFAESTDIRKLEINPDIKQKSLLELDDGLKFELKDPDMFVQGGDMNIDVDGRLPEQKYQQIKDGTSIGGQVTETGLDNKMSSFKQEDWDALGIDKNVNRDFTGMEQAKIDNYIDAQATSADTSLAYKDNLNETEFLTTKPKYQVTSGKSTATILSPEDVINQQAYNEPSGITKVGYNYQVNSKPIGQSFADEMTYDTYDVKTADLSADQLKSINKFNTTSDYFNNQAAKIQADATITEYGKDGKIISETINPEYTDFNKSMIGVKRGAALAASVEGVAMAAATPEEAYAGGVATPILETDITGATDYSQAYASAFQGAGYVGPNDFNSYTNAGYYGGDPFSIAQYNRRVATPQANIRIGG